MEILTEVYLFFLLIKKKTKVSRLKYINLTFIEIDVRQQISVSFYQKV